LPAIGSDIADLEVAERLVRLELRAMAHPLRLSRLLLATFPRAAPEVARRAEALHRGLAPHHLAQPEVGIEFPVPVGRQRGQRTEAGLALAKRVLGGGFG